MEGPIQLPDGLYFPFHHLGDRRGIIHHLSRLSGICGPGHRINLYWSVTMHGNPDSIAAPEFISPHCYTDDSPNAAVLVGLGYDFISPTHYTLGHCTHPGTQTLDETGFMRNWRLYGSSDGFHWVLLSAHIDDQTLSPDNPHAVFSLDHCDYYFCLFLITIGHHGNPFLRNSSNNFRMVLSCFELYGRLRTPAFVADLEPSPADPTRPDPRPTLEPESDKPVSESNGLSSTALDCSSQDSCGPQYLYSISELRAFRYLAGPPPFSVVKSAVYTRKWARKQDTAIANSYNTTSTTTKHSGGMQMFLDGIPPTISSASSGKLSHPGAPVGGGLALFLAGARPAAVYSF
eukprot:NODE_2449_length_1174_cov_13.350525_g2334_i0.p1 GENE.NODE_2449_length_1174_cov_13.350525_g2334_i0~~NODE_2449_length_1174_cov_13.350525_g2334_i0.p1  ORF type:complete len:346 (-),score=31.49 NODE_2449_length_1174_cov_13.350525_g2334_i0:40-1077(-)